MLDPRDRIQDENIDFRKYLFRILNNWYLFIFFILISFTVAYYVNKYTTTIYHVRSTILIDAGNQRKGAENLINGLNIFSGKTTIENEMGVLRSFSLTQKVIEELDFDIAYYSNEKFITSEIYNDCPFIVKMDSGHNQVFSHPITVKFLGDDKVFLETYEIVLDKLKSYA